MIVYRMDKDELRKKEQEKRGQNFAKGGRDNTYRYDIDREEEMFEKDEDIKL